MLDLGSKDCKLESPRKQWVVSEQDYLSSAWYWFNPERLECEAATQTQDELQEMNMHLYF